VRPLLALALLAPGGCSLNHSPASSSASPAVNPFVLTVPATELSSQPSNTAASSPAEDTRQVPKFDHIVIVVEENHSYREIKGNASAPYINSLMKAGANFTNFYATQHPSQPNYLLLFSGSTQGVKNDKPIHSFSSDNLASSLQSKNYTFAGYSEGLPKAGFTGPYDLKTGYARKHNPWVNFTNVPKESNLPFTSFPSKFENLPTVSFVVPNLTHDIHDGTIRQGDEWLKANLSAYAKWAPTHNSLLIVTWDEDDTSDKNRIPTFIVGASVRQGEYTSRYNHYDLLRTIEDSYGLEPLGKSKQAKPLPIWIK